jgi:signal transduction histidine kinase
VHQLLTLARLDGASRRAPETLNVVDEVRDALIAVAPRAQTRGVELSLDAPDALTLTLDRVALHSVIDNLLSNAVTWAKAGGRVQVRLADDAARGRWQLTVSDDGPGLPAADGHRVFERFQRGTDNPEAAGCGLGLAIVRQAAHQLGGDVSHGPGLDGTGASFVVSGAWGDATPS